MPGGGFYPPVRSHFQQILGLCILLTFVRHSVQEPNRFCGDGACCVVLNNGGVKCWGNGQMSGIEAINTYPADIGDDPYEMGDNLTYTQLGTGRTAVCPHSSYEVSCAIMDNSALKCWGGGDSDLWIQNRGGRLSRTCDSACSSCGITSEYEDDFLQPNVRAGVSVSTGTCHHACNASSGGYCAVDEAAYSNGVDCCGCAKDQFDFFTDQSNVFENQCSQIPYYDTKMGDNLPEIPIGTGRTVVDVASIDGAICVLTDDLQVKCWGEYDYVGSPAAARARATYRKASDLGDNLTAIDFGTSGEDVIQIAGSYYNYHFCAVFTNGKIKCWAECGDGCLGYGHTDTIGDDLYEMGDNLTFVDLGANAFAAQVSCGAEHTCAVLSSGKIKCWGHNGDGQLGTGDPENRGDDPGEMGDNLNFTDLGPEFHAVQVCAGSSHSCAISSDARVKCWGQAEALGLGLDHGSIGDDPNKMGNNLPYVDLGTGLKAVQISCADGVTCVIFDGGTVKCWGSDSDRLGLGDGVGRGNRPGISDMGDNLPFLDFGVGLSVQPCEGSATPKPEPSCDTSNGMPPWGSEALRHCTLEKPWEELMESLKKPDPKAWTGGLGRLQQYPDFGVWICVAAHPCGSGPKLMFCFVYHEREKTFYPWGTNDCLELVR
mmetsp:Transcript_8132/g.16217  ORF Transcript_8132/g.16217 Transcript_8132/m.16217 type:complete len:656 (-) Transcript_8132:298-2265(-)